jgi:5-(carboxyamino)imidazole ribonucleotide mutase
LKLPCESRVLSAHRTPGLLAEYVEGAADRGLEVIIAGAGMAAHLPGVVASRTSLPVLGVPIDAGVLDGLDALLSMVQMPSGVPVATFAIGRAGAVNAALFAAMIVSQRHPEFAAALKERREAERQALSTQTIPQGS